MTNTTFHCICLSCGVHYYYHEVVTIVHNAGFDWEDSSDFCPVCGQPQMGPSEYQMRDGSIPPHAQRVPLASPSR